MHNLYSIHARFISKAGSNEMSLQQQKGIGKCLICSAGEIRSIFFEKSAALSILYHLGQLHRRYKYGENMTLLTSGAVMNL